MIALHTVRTRVAVRSGRTATPTRLVAEGARGDAVIEAEGNLTLLKVAASLLEQASVPCQLRFNKVFLRELIERLQRGPARAQRG